MSLLLHRFKKALYSPMCMGAVLLLAVTPSAMAQEVVKSDNGQTKVEIDDENHTITFMIKGEPVAMFSEQGLIVIDNIEYGGMLTDYGQEAVQEKISGAVVQPKRVEIEK